MYRIVLHTELHELGEYYRLDDYQEVPVIEDEIPRDYIYNTDSGEPDIYSLAIWGRGVFCKKVVTQNRYYMTEASGHFIDLLDSLEIITKDHSSIFDYWFGNKVSEKYDLVFCVYSTNQELLEKYISAFEKWIATVPIAVEDDSTFPKLAEEVSCSSDSFSKSLDSQVLREIESDQFLARFGNIINWSIPCPEFEGNNGFVCLSVAITLLPIIISIISYFSIDKRKYRQTARRIKIGCQAIRKKYSVRGILKTDANTVDSFDKDGDNLYIFDEFVDNQLIARYSLCFYRLGFTPFFKYTIRKMKVDDYLKI